MAYFKEPLCSEDLILTDKMIEDIVSTVLAEMSTSCCITFQTEDGKSPIEKWREAFSLEISKRYDIPITQLPGIDALVAGLVRSFEGAMLGPYKPFVGLIQGVMKALKCPPKAPKNLKKMIKALICYLENFASNGIEEFMRAAIMETIGDFSEKAMIPLPNTDVIIDIMLGKTTLEKELDKFYDIRKMSLEEKKKFIEDRWILPSKIKDIAFVELGVFLKPDMESVKELLVDEAGLPVKSLCIIDLIAAMLNSKSYMIDPADLYVDEIREVLISAQERFSAALNTSMFVKIFEIVKMPITLARSLVETLICLLKALVSKPVKAIKEVISILKNPSKWAFDKIKESLTVAFAGLLSGVLGDDPKTFALIQSILDNMLSALFENAPAKFPALSELCKIMNAELNKARNRIETEVMLKAQGGATLVLMLISIIKAVISYILCVPNFLGWLFAKARKKSGPMSEEERKELFDNSVVPVEALGIIFAYRTSFSKEIEKTVMLKGIGDGFSFGESTEDTDALCRVCEDGTTEYLDTGSTRFVSMEIDLGEDASIDDYTFLNPDAPAEERLVDVIAYAEADVDEDDIEKYSREELFRYIGHSEMKRELIETSVRGNKRNYWKTSSSKTYTEETLEGSVIATLEVIKAEETGVGKVKVTFAESPYDSKVNQLKADLNKFWELKIGLVEHRSETTLC